MQLSSAEPCSSNRVGVRQRGKEGNRNFFNENLSPITESSYALIVRLRTPRDSETLLILPKILNASKGFQRIPKASKRLSLAPKGSKRLPKALKGS